MSNFTDLQQGNIVHDRTSIADSNWTNFNVFTFGNLILNDVLLLSEPLDRNTKGNTSSLVDLTGNSMSFSKSYSNTSSFVRVGGSISTFTDIQQ